MPRTKSGMREFFIERKFYAKTLTMIERANAILAEYAAQGFILTLRQLFYQFVAGSSSKTSKPNRTGWARPWPTRAGRGWSIGSISKTARATCKLAYASPAEVLQEAADASRGQVVRAAVLSKVQARGAS